MKVMQLPPSVLLAVFTFSALIEASPPFRNLPRFPNKTKALASTGSGPEYATACQAAISSYASAEASWDSVHNYISNTTQLLGGTSWFSYTLYENATTLCDRMPRVTYSPAISIGNGTSTYPGPVTATTTIVGSYGRIFPESSPSCSIKPTDCDPLWVDYSKSLLAASTMTAAPSLTTPPCVNQTQASKDASISSDLYGCNVCTIYGDGVELVYFPTTASRDMCASTPTATITHYGPGAVITAYAGKSYQGPDNVNGSRTVVVDGHTFTSGTAYISISRVYAVDRCSKTYGTVVSDAIIAMPSESVLSLRYRQDHFQRLMTTDQITGYPVSYADFNTPIPWSAWNGQNQCQGWYDTWYCGVIYENKFRPQLAIPPEITKLSPDFEGCQMWYNGLWDPPLALTEYETAAKPTLPNAPGKTTAPVQGPSSAPAAPTAAPTAIPNELPTQTRDNGKPTLPVNGPSLPNGKPTQEAQPSTYPSPSSAKPPQSQDHSDHQKPSHTQPNEKPTEKSAQQPSRSAGNNVPRPDHDAPGDSNTAHHGPGPSKNTPSRTAQATIITNTCVPSKEPWQKDFAIGGRQIQVRGRNRAAVIGSVTCVAGGPKQTITEGTITVTATYGEKGLLFDTKSTMTFDEEPAATATGQSGTGTEAGNGDADTVTITIQGEPATVVQSQDGGPVVIDESTTLTPGGEATTLEDGEIISAASNGVVVGSTSTFGLEAITTDAEASETSSTSVSQGNNDFTPTRTGASQSIATQTGGAPLLNLAPITAMLAFIAAIAVT